MTATGGRVAVIGGGITGVAAARALVGHGIAVHLIEGADRPGGCIRTSPFAGLPAVDEGPDAFLVRAPGAIDLARAIGLGEDLVHPEPVGAAVWHRRLHPIPDGIVLGVPSSLGAVARSGLLSPIGMLRAGLDLVRPASPVDHDAIGTWVRARFGAEVHDRLVDALVGSIYGADTNAFSLTAVPQLAGLASAGRSALLSARAAAVRTRPPAGAERAPIFAAPAGGMSALVDRTLAGLWSGPDGSFTMETGRRVERIERDGRRWRVDGTVVDAVVVAAPARAAATLLAGVAPEASTALSTIETAGVVMVTLRVPGDEWPISARGRSGYLVPKSVQRTVTAVSFGSQKWAHWAPDDGSVIVRVSLGRDGLDVMHLDDDAILGAVVDEVGVHLGCDLQPTDSRITRWPAAFAQYRPHHHRLVAGIDTALPAGVVLAGASYRGIGIPACVADAERAARTVVAHLSRAADATMDWS
jgi:protoporphyrinogen/coproporphyrinogen III oxidase